MPRARAASKTPPKSQREAPPTSRREARRLAQQGVGRTQLLDAAEHVFGRKGFHETTLKEVADLAEFSVGSVYSFFENKDDLFRQIFVRRGEQFMPGLHGILDETARLYELDSAEAFNQLRTGRVSVLVIPSDPVALRFDSTRQESHIARLIAGTENRAGSRAHGTPSS